MVIGKIMKKSPFFNIGMIFGVIFSISMCTTAPPEIIKEDTAKELIIYIGTNEGLYSVNAAGITEALWTGGSVKKILFVPGKNNQASEAAGIEKDTWVILSSEGILVSEDLKNWEKRNHGLPEKTIKIFDEGQKSFLKIVQEIKDVEVNPSAPRIMVCNTKDRVYLSRNQGRSWTALAPFPYRANGIKAVASAFLPELTVFLSHSLYGIYYTHPDTTPLKWTQLPQGLEQLETTGNPDEVSDIAVVALKTDGLHVTHELFVSQTFRRRIYKLDWNQKKFDLVWAGGALASGVANADGAVDFGTVDSLYPGDNGLYFLYEGNAAHLDFNGYNKREYPQLREVFRALPANIKPNCAVLDDAQKIILSELWLLDEPKDNTTNVAANKEGIYLPVDNAINRNALNGYLNLMEKAGLNMFVIDMKDDQGCLRFTPKNSAVSAKGRVVRPLDIDSFLAEMKQRGIYTVARIVVFKDKELAERENGKYAVWDKNGIPWIGTGFSNERWVDPYSEEVWDYIALISAELCQRGFDEIQFDYIRFPTDGENLNDARYRWQDNGMDMESAMLSFLRHIRPKVKAPISIDIYGANGWYRTGARTGQEVELLAPWVDVICPMYYPSHFEQDFFAHAPPEMRPFRIYHTGTLRNDRISRGQVIIRPWAQAFYLNVSYDKKYYNTDYVRRQIEGVKKAGSGGYTYWTMGGYQDIPLVK